MLTGAVPWEELPAHYAAGDVFAMPCRTRRGGLEVEGLGIVYLEASATGLPVVAGRLRRRARTRCSTGATGVVVDGRSVEDVAGAVVRLACRTRETAAAMGRGGRDWVEQEWRWDVLTERLRTMLAGP